MKLPWDTDIDTPATVAVIGGGAIGIEAALYARFLGYYVLLIEGSKMAQTWRRGGKVPMLTPFGQAASPLGQAALEAHRPDSPLPDAGEILSTIGFAEQYLVPVAKTDLLSECVHVHSRVVTISRLESRRESICNIQDRADMEFRLAIHSKNRGWFSERADIVLDCTGVGLPRALGPGGGLAMGELEHADRITPNVLDLSGKERGRYAGARILLFGACQTAIMNLLALVELVAAEPLTRVIWVVPLEPGITEPIQWLERLRNIGGEVAQLAERSEVHDALAGTQKGIVTLPALGIDRISSSADGLSIRVQTDEDNTLDIECDQVLSGSGYEPDWEHAAALRVCTDSIFDRPSLEITCTAEPVDHSAMDALRTHAPTENELLESILTM